MTHFRSHLFSFLNTWVFLFLLSSHSVFANENMPDPASQATSKPSIILPVKSWLLMDYETGTVLEEHNGYEPVDIASITKLMSAYIVTSALENKQISEDDKVTISAYARSQIGSRMFVEQNSQVSVRNLIHGMIIQSGNDATVALAEHIAGSEEKFVEIMNQTAQELGLQHTHYENTTGLPSPTHLSTAYDIALLSSHIIRDYPEHYSLYAEKEFTWNNITQKNRNRLLWMDTSVDGLKTGHTDAAGYCLVSSAIRNDFRLIAVVLGAENETIRYQSSLNLLNYGYEHFESQKLYEAKQIIGSVKLTHGKQSSLKVGSNKALKVTLPKNQYDQIIAKIQVDDKLQAPIQEGEEVARLVLQLNGKTLLNQKLIALENIERAGIIKRLFDEAWFRIKNKIKHLALKI